MTVTQAIVKVRDDIISWCTLNFRKKADTSTVAAVRADLDEHTSENSVQIVAAGSAKLYLSGAGHVTDVESDTYLNNYVSSVDAVNSISVGYLEPKTDALTIMPSTSRQYVRIPTISKMCQNQTIVLTKDKQYGDETPPNPVNGQLFFLKAGD